MKAKEKFVGFDVLKRSVSIQQVLDRYGLTDRLHRSGDSLSGACPLHSGHNKTQFRVSISKNIWICFGNCHVGGSIVDFVSRKEGIGIRDAALLIQDWFHVEPSQNGNGHSKPNGHPRPERFGNAPLRFELKNLDGTHPYLTQRGLNNDTIATFGVGCCKVGTLNGWIAIPIHNVAGQLVAYAARWPGEPKDQPKYRLPKGFRKSLELFNLHRAKAEDAALPLIVVEGFFGCMKLWQLGHHRVVSTMGSMLSEAQAELIAQTVGLTGKVIVIFDEDEAGRKGRQEAKERLKQQVTLRVVSLPIEGMQPDQLSAEDLSKLMEGLS